MVLKCFKIKYFYIASVHKAFQVHRLTYYELVN